MDIVKLEDHELDARVETLLKEQDRIQHNSSISRNDKSYQVYQVDLKLRKIYIEKTRRRNLDAEFPKE